MVFKFDVDKLTPKICTVMSVVRKRRRYMRIKSIW